MDKNKLQEMMLGGGNNTTVNIKKADLGDTQITGNLNKLGKDVTVNVVPENSTPNKTTEELEILEPEAVIAPQDKATMKYLSNVKDIKTGQISQPFTIGAQRYQMVRALSNDDQIVMAVFAHDETDDNGQNVIYTVEDFERDIALPMKEAMGMVGKNIQVVDEDTYEGYKHYLVNKQTNEIRKFKTIEEMLSCNKSVDEDYMGATKFKQYMTEKLFGRRKRMNELDSDPAQEMGLEEAQQLAILVIKALQNNSAISAKLKRVYDSKNVQVKQTLLDYFIKAIGMNPNQIGKYVKTVRDTAKELKNKDAQGSEPTEQPITEKRVISKKYLEESLIQKKVIKTVKVKDIK